LWSVAIAEDKDILVLVKFGISGNLRFLSHIEEMMMFQQACVRAGVDMVYSQGFNPHPVFSIPLPKPVAVESDDDYFCIRIRNSQPVFDGRVFQNVLSENLPAGINLHSVCVSASKDVPVPDSAEIFLPVKTELLTDKLKRENLECKIAGLLNSASLIVERKAEPKTRRVKKVDVRPFIDDIRLDEQGVLVRCNITYGGSVRVDEIITLLGLCQDCLAGPVRRQAIKWNLNG
jgi:radical SAM-linked protein